MEKAVHKSAIVAAVALLLFLPLFQQNASAHKPIDPNVTINNNFQNAIHIPDPSISWAIYQNLDSDSPALFYEFHVQKSQQVFIQLTIPQLKGLQNYNPKLAIIGPDVSPAMIIRSESTSISEDNFNFPWVESSISSSSLFSKADKIISISYQQQARSTPQVFYEPFTQTSYWKKQELVARIPRDGQYFLVVYVRNPQDLIESSKFTLAVGEKEDFKPLDYVTTLPLAWIKTKLFFEDYFSIFLVVVILILIPISIVVLVLRRRKLKESR